MAGTKNSGRRSLREELGVLERFTQLSPKAFAFVSRMFDSPALEDQKWAADWLKPAYAKMIPQKIAGDPDNRTPIPLLNVLYNNSTKEGSGAQQKDTSSTGGNVSEQDNLRALIPD